MGIRINKSIVIGALARDCAKSIKENKYKIESLRSFFAESFVVIIENDSKDETKQILFNYASESENVTIVSKDYNGIYPFSYTGASKYKGMNVSRIARMVFFRNILFDYIKNHYNPDYVLFLDIDIKDFDDKGIVDAISGAPEGWGALFANGCYILEYCGARVDWPLQYDMYAYVEKDRNIDEITVMEKSPDSTLLSSKLLTRNIQDSPYFEVTSAFGGIGVYKYNAIKDLRYEVYAPSEWRENNMCLCEHISFNKAIVNKGFKNYIARSIKCEYGVFRKNFIVGLIMYHFPILYSRFIRLFR